MVTRKATVLFDSNTDTYFMGREDTAVTMDQQYAAIDQGDPDYIPEYDTILKQCKEPRGREQYRNTFMNMTEILQARWQNA